jgi:heptaprenyl diphosphate synthase
MIGDYLFAKANQQAAKVGVEVAEIISKTIESLCEGEMLEMTDEFNIKRSIGGLIQTIEGKTAALISATCQIAGYCADFSQTEIDSLKRYGKDFGMSFQFIDDVLDFLSSQEILGKPTGNDAKEGVYNMPILLSLAGKEKNKVNQMIANPNKIANSKLTDLLISNGTMLESIILANEYNNLAARDIDNLNHEQVKKSLANLPNAYFIWALENLTQPKYKRFISETLNNLPIHN